MHDALFEGHVSKRSRPLVHALIISVALNLGLLATFITFIIKEKKVEKKELRWIRYANLG